MQETVGYSGTPLYRKLGIAAFHRVLLDGRPAGFEMIVPQGATVHERNAGGGIPYDVILAFCPDLRRLRRRWPILHGRTNAAGALWIAWPKKASGVPTDLTEDVIREFALANGRVDTKVCAIDEVWSGLKHVIRVTDR